MNRSPSPIPFGVVDVRPVVVIEGVALSMLSPQETDILQTLLNNPGQIFSNRMLHFSLRSKAEYKLIDVLMCKIRRKLDTAFGPSGPPITIDTIWGLGYYLRLHDTPEIAPVNRWTPLRKRGFFAQFKYLERTDSDEVIAAFRATAPEISDNLILEWDQFGCKAIF